MDKIITDYIPFNHRFLINKRRCIENYNSLENIQINFKELKEAIENLIRPPQIEFYKEGNNAFFFYVGKIGNYLKNETIYPDLPVILFLESLSRFGKFTIIVENKFFDMYVLDKPSTEKRVMKFIYHLKSKGFFKNLEFVSMYSLNKEIPEFLEEFKKYKTKVKNDEVFKILKNSIDYPDLESALNNYPNLSKAKKVYKRYMAFIEARKKVRYWDKLIEKYGWIRATVSRKDNITSIKPTLHKIPVAHSIFNARYLRDSYLIDELFENSIKYRILYRKIPMWYH